MIILGDLNLHLDIPSHHTETFTDILTSFRLLQHVNFPAHIHGHWLDLCITLSASQIVFSIFPSDGLSDHLTVIAELQSDLHRHTAKKQITYRRINQIDINNFKTDNFVKSQLFTNPKLSADSLYKQFHDTLSSILNTHAPPKTKSVSPKPPNPWITSAIQAANRTRRYLERVWRKSRFPSDRSKYVKQAHLCNRMMERARREHIANYIDENENDAGKLWRAVNSVLHRVPNTSMPTTSDITTLCHSFSTFFVNKIEKIRMKFCDPKHNVPHISPPENNFPMTSFEPATADEVNKLILTSQDKSCDLDPLPTKLLNSHHEHCQFMFGIRLFPRRFEGITHHTLIKETITV